MLTENEVIDRDTTGDSETVVAVEWYVGDNNWEELWRAESYSAAKDWISSPEGIETLCAGDRIRFVVIATTVAYEDNITSLPRV